MEMSLPNAIAMATELKRKLVAILAFLLITSPTATHALSRSALLQNVRPWTADEEDGSSSG